MERWEGYWRRFEKTGGVMDYLNYTACTREAFPDEEEAELSDGEEVEEDAWNGHREWDGAVRYADRRIR